MGDRNKFFRQAIDKRGWRDDNAIVQCRTHITMRMNAVNTTKRNAAITTAITLGACNALTLKFANGECLVLDIARVAQEVQNQAMLHGFKQKLLDAAALSRNPETGRTATIEDKYQAVRTVYDRLLAGQWNATREGGGPPGGLLLQALCRMYAGRKTQEELRAFLTEKSDAERTALRKNPRLATLIEAIRAEQGKATNIDTDELLGELD